ncbi:MAG: hypothetical protein HY094_01330 [Candidatus Melainabacteria bacterium]|nr:hypothetical protein [Candidatus Melainabacteria bacterium]
MITILSVTPDMLVSGFFYLASGLLIKIKLDKARWFTFLILGIVLAFGYFSKTVMFPIAFIFICTAIFAIPKKINLPQVLISLITFLLLISPYVYELSRTKGYFTFGEVWKLNYEWDADRSFCESWKPGFPGCGKLIHPPRIIFHKPTVFEYSSPFMVTYPLHYDPSYWCQGDTEPYFDFRSQVKALVRSIREFYLLFYMQGIVVIVSLCFFFISRRGIKSFKDIREQWLIFIPAVLSMLMYSFVHFEPRYIGAFMIIFWLGLFSALKLPDNKEVKRITSCFIGVLSALLIITSIFSEGVITMGPHNTNHQIAKFLKVHDINKGDKIATIFERYQDIYWARLAKVNIVAEIPEEEINNFWNSNDSIKLQVLKTFKSIGVKAVIAKIPAYDLLRSNWIKIEDSEYYLYVL